MEVRIESIVEYFLFDEFPEPFNEIEIGRIWRKENQMNLKPLGGSLYQQAALVAGIV